MTRKTKMEQEVINLGVSYGKSIEFIAIAKDTDAANRFATTMRHMQRAGAKNIKVSVTNNEVYFSSSFSKRQKTKVCYFIVKHANDQKVTIPCWLRSHASFYKCHTLKGKKENVAKEPVASEQPALSDLQARLGKQGKRKYNKRKSPASRASDVQVQVQSIAPEKVSLFTKFVNWLFK